MCDGIGGALLALNTVFASVTRYLAVECHDVSRVICNNVNSGAHGGAIPDHTWANRVEDITEQKIKVLGPGNVKHVAFGPPCKDHSKLRLIPRYKSARFVPPKTKAVYSTTVRPSLNGKHGQIFRRCLTVLLMVVRYNPDCEFFCENVDFSDMPDDWAGVCGVLSAPYIITADCCSFTRRRRLLDQHTAA